MPSSRQSGSHSGGTAGFSASVVSDEAALRGLEDDWNSLSAKSRWPNAFMTYGWYKAWNDAKDAQSGGVGNKPHVVVLRQGNEVAGIVPLVKRIASPLFRMRKLQFVSTHADYHDPVLSNDTEGLIAAFVEHLVGTAAQWDILDLRDLRDVDGSKAAMERAMRQAGLRYFIEPEEEGCPYLKIDGDLETIMKRLSGHARRTLRRRGERATAEGFRVRIIENPHLEPGSLEKLVALDWKKHLHKSSPQFVGQFPEVFRSLIDALGPRGWLYVALLENESDSIAFQFGFRCGDKLWDYSKAYDRSFSRFAPGTLILPALLDYSCTKGFQEYDFLRGEEPYKMEWSDGCHQRYRLLIWNHRGLSRIRKFLYHDVRGAIHRHRQSPREPRAASPAEEDA
jgi:CelD/BcsL family acetyltransferase involved in cellulose biosynthesis